MPHPSSPVASTMDGAQKSLLRFVTPEIFLDESCNCRHGTKHSCFVNIFPIFVRSEIATDTKKQRQIPYFA